MNTFVSVLLVNSSRYPTLQQWGLEKSLEARVEFGPKPHEGMPEWGLGSKLDSCPKGIFQSPTSEKLGYLVNLPNLFPENML